MVLVFIAWTSHQSQVVQGYGAAKVGVYGTFYGDLSINIKLALDPS